MLEPEAPGVTITGIAWEKSSWMRNEMKREYPCMLSTAGRERVRLLTCVHFHVARLFSHPLSFLAMLGRVITGKCRTKGEMTARRMVRDTLDRLAALGHRGEE